MSCSVVFMEKKLGTVQPVADENTDCTQTTKQISQDGNNGAQQGGNELLGSCGLWASFQQTELK